MNLLLLVVTWTAVVIILHCLGLGVFATWYVTAWPWQWSCCCILWLYLCFLAIVFGGVCGVKLIAYVRKRGVSSDN